MYFVYILRSEKDASKYIGVTEDLRRRLLEHNSRGKKFTTSKKPYHIVWYCVFKEKRKAYEFEKYLKSSSGYAFVKKHLI